VVRLADRLLDRLGPVIETLEEQMADIDVRSATGNNRGTRNELRDVRRRTMRLRRWVGPQRDVIARLAADQGPLFDEGQRLRLLDETNRVTRYVEDLDDLHERAAAVHDVISQQLSEDMNRTMYFLSVVAAIVLPLALITELMSLDLDGIPGREVNGVLYLVLLVLIAGALSTVFWRTRGRLL
jgi:zinc transporter